MLISNFHITCGALALGVEPAVLNEAMSLLECQLWHPSDESVEPIDPPLDKSELWTVFFQCSHILGPLVASIRPKWASWLHHSASESKLKSVPFGVSVSEVTSALVRHLDAADCCISETFVLLNEKGFQNPTDAHVLDVAANSENSPPRILLRAALSLVSTREDSGSKEIAHYSGKRLAGSLLRSNERLGFWGYADSSFLVDIDKNGSPFVVMKGGRYRDRQERIKGLVKFIENEIGVPIDPLCEAFHVHSSSNGSQMMKTSLDARSLVALSTAVKEFTIEEPERLRHGSGHTIEDVYHIRNGDILRVPDAVAWPESEIEVDALIETASRLCWCIIPFGGGTNVSHATRCPPIEVEPRPIISVDLTSLNKILWVDHENMLAHVQAGIRGGDLVREMKCRGYTIGHEPDSIEFSTLGGWIATKASGMKRSKYGNIEDIVKSVKVSTPRGPLHHGSLGERGWGRTSTGLDLGSVVVGSEGCLGIITSAVIKIWPLPEKQEYEGILLADFTMGMDFVRDVAKMENSKPASCRLLDNKHFRLGVALRSSPNSLFQSLQGVLQKLVLQTSPFEADRCVCATITYEGTREQILFQKRVIHRLAQKHGGMLLGRESGKSGYDLTFLIAYLRDFALSYHLMGESFETFAPWSKANNIINAVEKRILDEHRNRCLPGKPFLGCRVTQLYDEGACLYFYLCMSYKNVPDPMKTFSEIETAARKDILDQGGSLSHHHGVGKVRASFMPLLKSKVFQDVQHKMKEGLDPDNIFGARNGAYADTAASTSVSDNGTNETLEDREGAEIRA